MKKGSVKMAARLARKQPADPFDSINTIERVFINGSSEGIGYERAQTGTRLVFCDGKTVSPISPKDALIWWSEMEVIGRRFNLDSEWCPQARAEFLRCLGVAWLNKEGAKT